jgi:uncharacterized protein
MKYVDTAAIRAIFRRDSRGLSQAIEGDPGLVEAADSDGRTPLHHAIIEDEVEAAAVLIAAGANVDAPDRSGWTPLHVAAQANSASAVQTLLRAGADPNALDAHGNSPLFRAVFSSGGDGAVIRLLQAAGADADRPNRAGVSPRQLANTIANFPVRQFFD